jgi:AcrR family transcriptional regulator
VFVARPLSEDKRQAILNSAAEAVAALGVSAPTARIAADAGIAEGTLFSYFPTKDALLNQLYLEIKNHIGVAMMTGFKPRRSLNERWRHLWGRYIDWGAAHPAKRKALRQLSVSDRITESSKETGGRAFGDVMAMVDEGRAAGVMRDQPPAFIGAIMESLAETTLDFIAREPKQREYYKDAGFAALWNALFKS